jgi:CheY-like chemotaxis protein
LLDLINEVLDISRIEADRMQLSVEPVCVDDAIAEAIDLMRPLAAERSITLSPPVQLKTSSFVLADRQRLKQVLLNLLTNAVKYNSTGGNVTISHRVAHDNQLRVAVSDTGAGIPREKLWRIFTPFDRLGAEQSSVEGTGLGLALSQRLMKAMGGSIGVESTVNEGSTFWVELAHVDSPLQQAAVHKKITRHRQERRAGDKKRTVLYIEDNVSNQKLIEQILEEEPDVQLITAMQGQAGLDLARQHSPDLILLDLHLPDLPGWEVLAQLQTSESTRHIPTVVISADATARQIKRLMAAGAHTYLTKPVDMTEFLRVFEQTTNGSAQLANA